MKPTASIIIPSIGRPESLKRCLESIKAGSFKDYEIILEKTKGPLAKIRNLAARRASGKYLIFIDDDTWCTPHWLAEILHAFHRPRVKGVSGPAVISPHFRRNRDLFRFRWLKLLRDRFFTDGNGHLPGHITKAGAWTTGASEETCNYSGEVHFLEACNMAFEAATFRSVGGFDETYKGVGDWSEPDLCFRIRKKGWKLYFSPKARLYHEPSRTGAFKKRKADSKRRMANYLQFSKRWVSPNWRHDCYKAFLRTYYAFKTIT